MDKEESQIKSSNTKLKKSPDTESPDDSSQDSGENSENVKECDEHAKGEIFSKLVELTDELLASWSELKEAFRIPKKERIQLMKEHEWEVEREYRSYLATKFSENK